MAKDSVAGTLKPYKFPFLFAVSEEMREGAAEL